MGWSKGKAFINDNNAEWLQQVNSSIDMVGMREIQKDGGMTTLFIQWGLFRGRHLKRLGASFKITKIILIKLQNFVIFFFQVTVNSYQ